MNIKNGVLKIDSSLNNLELEKLSHEIKNNIDQIKEVTIDKKSIVTSSCLFTLLISIKKAKTDMSIPILDEEIDIEGFGNVSIISKG
jgi:hypothetical protein